VRQVSLCGYGSRLTRCPNGRSHSLAKCTSRWDCPYWSLKINRCKVRYLNGRDLFSLAKRLLWEQKRPPKPQSASNWPKVPVARQAVQKTFLIVTADRVARGATWSDDLRIAGARRGSFTTLYKSEATGSRVCIQITPNRSYMNYGAIWNFGRHLVAEF
jgi:hypothetical protein